MWTRGKWRPHHRTIDPGHRLLDVSALELATGGEERQNVVRRMTSRDLGGNRNGTRILAAIKRSQERGVGIEGVSNRGPTGEYQHSQKHDARGECRGARQTEH